MEGFKVVVALVRLQGYVMVFYAFYGVMTPLVRAIVLIQSDGYIPNYLGALGPYIAEFLMQILAAILLLKFPRTVAGYLWRGLGNDDTSPSDRTSPG